MGQKDISEKLLEDYDDVFADIVNVLLFQGKKVVNPKTLSATKVKSQYKANDSKLHEMERDVAKHWREENLILALYGIENQTAPEKMMPARVLAYDGISYRSQLMKERANSMDAKNLEERAEQEPVKHSELYPVVTIVLYFGMKRWNQPKNLKEIIRVPSKLDSYVNDYKIHVFEIAWLTEEQVGMFQSDFRIVAEYFTQIRRNNSYEPTEHEIQHVDEVLKLLSIFGEEEGIEKFLHAQRKKGNDKMAGVIDRMVEERSEKRAQEMIQQMAVEFVRNGFPVEQVAKVMKVSVQQVETWAEMRANEK